MNTLHAICAYGHVSWSEFIWKSGAASPGQFEEEKEVWLQNFVTARVVFICWISNRVAACSFLPPVINKRVTAKGTLGPFYY